MMTGADYLASLADGRVVYFEGRRVDVTTEPGFVEACQWIAGTYDRFFDPAPDATNPVFHIPRTAIELRERVEMLVNSDITMSLSAVAFALLTAAPAMASVDPVFGERIARYYAECVRRDVRFAEVITDAKGDRSLGPSKQADPDSYLRVVGRDADGIVIRGAKFHITAGPLAHELIVMPTKRMKAGEEDYAVCCAVPANARGVIQIAASHHPRSDDTRSHPISARTAHPDAMVIFDDVHVPWDRVFLDGAVEQSAAVAHALGLWERLSGCAHLAEVGDLLAGLAQLIAEANGTDRIAHVRDKITDITLYATMVRACFEAALANAVLRPDGMLVPDELYTNAGKYAAANDYAVMVRHLHDIAGGTVVTAPTMADYDNTDLRPFIDKYLVGRSGVSGEYRMRLFHAIRDLTADSWGGREAVSWLQSGGGLYAQRSVLRGHYDIDRAKRLALDVAGLTDLAPAATVRS
jgi:4-hydroxybutyryl-CoA dehydratase / vinylacetyl-CoA-Delta-isomerase